MRKKVLAKVIKALENVSEGFNLYVSYVAAGEAEAIYIWETLQLGFEQLLRGEKTPGMERKAYKIIQFYPPSIDLYSMIYSILFQS